MYSKSSEETSELAVKVAECEHFRAAVLFIKELEVAGGRLRGMLGSATTSDVVEALRFLVKVRWRYGSTTAPRWRAIVVDWRAAGGLPVLAFVFMLRARGFFRGARVGDAGVYVACACIRGVRDLPFPFS